MVEQDRVVEPTWYVKSVMLCTVPEYTAARISSPGLNRLFSSTMMIPDELPSMMPTWSLGSGGTTTFGKSGPG
jgi:hypothetical protein